MNTTSSPKIDLTSLSNVLRGLAIDAVETAGHGHPGAAMGMADIATVLYAKHLIFDPSKPHWPDRDRVVLSNGHASILLYGLLYLTGVPGLELGDIKAFRQKGSKTPGHPETGHTPGVEVTTGPLGQGIAMSVGLAIAERRLRDDFGADVCNHRTWVFVGDGCLMEGVGQEAASLAGHLGLGKLNVLYDCNKITIDGSTDLSFTEDTAAKFRAMGWHVLEACGHTHTEIDDALAAAKSETGKPSLVIFRTIIGYGAPTKAGTSGIHGARLGSNEAAATKRALNLPDAPFEILSEHLSAWRSFGCTGSDAHIAWQERVAELAPDYAQEYARRMKGDLVDGLQERIEEAKKKAINTPGAIATRKASQVALELFTELLPELIGGSADLTGSNLTRTAATAEPFCAAQTGRYINYGVREFAMGAIMNGIALHGGLMPYGGTFLVFSDYMRNAIRMAALMKAKTLFVMTHDSIGLGEDGPTHQPIEHLASLRAIPGLHVFRPADLVETLEAYEVALHTDGPSLFAFSRQSVPQVRTVPVDGNPTAKGGYVLVEPEGRRDITLIATGTEVSLAVEAARDLQSSGILAAVVSLPCWSLFDAQDQSYRAAVLGHGPRIAIEAASPFGWTRYVAFEGAVIGVRDFGASASAEELYEQFGLTVENIVARVRAELADQAAMAV